MKIYCSYDDSFTANPNYRAHYASQTDDPDKLAIYLYDPDIYVRECAAANKHTRIADFLEAVENGTLDDIIYQEDVWSLYNFLCDHEDVPWSDWIRVLGPIQDYPQAKIALVRHKDAPEDMLVELADDQNFRIRAEVARNPNTPDDIIERLAYDEDNIVREYVTMNPRAPRDILVHLMRDPSGYVRECAENALRSRE